MVILKALAVLAAGLMSVLAIGLAMRQMQAAKARVRSRRPTPRGHVRLRQDPRTGIYYPER
jgi:hypothetical protein